MSSFCAIYMVQVADAALMLENVSIRADLKVVRCRVGVQTQKQHFGSDFGPWTSTVLQ